MENFAIIADVKELNKAIASIGKRSANLDADTHVAACSALWHIEKDGQTTPFNNLIAAMGKSTRKNALIAWAEHYGKCRWNAKKKAIAYSKDAESDIDAAQANPFWEFKPEPEYKPLDLQKAIAKLVEKAESHLAETNEKDNIPADLLLKLRALAA